MADEVWLRGPIEGYAAELQPVAHALLQAREDLHGLLQGVETDRLWRAPGSAAAVAWHVRHLTGSLDRLLTYARGELLTDTQVAALKAERTPDPQLGAAQLLDIADRHIDAALEQVRNTPVASLSDARGVGRKQLPSTVRGLLFHAAEHASRHVGQISTTLKIV